MTDQYSVDDILEEINRKRQAGAETPKPAAPKMPDLPAAPPIDTRATRIDLPAVKTEKPADDPFATRVMESARPAKAPSAAPSYSIDDSIDITALFGDDERLRRLRAQKAAQSEKPAAPSSAELADTAVFEPPEDSRAAASPAAPAAPPRPAAGKAPFIITIDDDDDDEIEFSPQDRGEPEPKKERRARRAAEKKAARAEQKARRKAEKRAAKSDRAETAPAAASKIEYRSPDDADSVRTQLSRLRGSLLSRLIVTGVCFVFSLYLTLCNLQPLPLLAPLCPENNMTLYLVTCLVPLFLAALVAAPVLVNGFSGLFTRRASHDTPAALCVFSVFAHTIALIASGSFAVGKTALYPSVAVITLFFNTLGKLLMVSRIRRNFAVVSSGSDLVGEYLLQGGDLARHLTGLLDEEELGVVYPARVGFAENFLALSYSPDYSERMCRSTAPLMLIFSLISSLLCAFVFRQGAIGGLSVFCVMLCLSSALSETLVGNLPLWRASGVLTKEGAFVAGYAASDSLGDMDAIVVDANELYPAGSAILHGIKAFRQDRIDSAILYAASILNASDGVLRDAFLETVGGKTGVLHPVSALKGEEGGLAATVDAHAVLFGSRAFLMTNGVALPPPETEEKYVKTGRDPLWLAEDGEAIALFVVSYRVSRSVEQKLHLLAKKQIQLALISTDPNLTPARIEEDYGFPSALITPVAPERREECLQLCRPRLRADACAMSIAGSRVRLRLLAALHTLRSSIRLGTLIQTAGLLFGYALSALLAFLGSVGSLGFGQILVYQLFWLIAASLFPTLMRF